MVSQDRQFDSTERRLARDHENSCLRPNCACGRRKRRLEVASERPTWIHILYTYRCDECYRLRELITYYRNNPTLRLELAEMVGRKGAVRG